MYRKINKFSMTGQQILAKIRQLLKQWESYGYLYFIGDGRCPREKRKREPTVEPVEPSSTRRRTISITAPVRRTVRTPIPTIRYDGIRTPVTGGKRKSRKTRRTRKTRRLRKKKLNKKRMKRKQ